MIKVIDVICDALKLIDRADAAEAYEAGSLTEEQERLVNVLLHCYNSVEDELSRGSFPLICEEEAEVSEGKLYYTALSHTPIKVISVTSGTQRLKFRMNVRYMEVNAAQVTVKYYYGPQRKGLEDDGEYDGIKVSQRLLAYGVAAEYTLIQGNYEESACWESRYKLAIESARTLTPQKNYIPPRRWA